MTLLVVSFLAGVLTVLAPCILPLLPIIIGGSVGGEDHKDRLRPVIIAASLAGSIVLFTLALKVSTAFIDIPQSAWSIISGVIILFFGLISVFPEWWEKFAAKFNLQGKSNELLDKSNQKKSRWGEVLLGASLGPVFSSCSPTYFLILATVLPESFSTGLVYLIAYALGLSLVLFLVSIFGQALVSRLGWAADPKGWFKRGLGILFLLVGILILTGADKQLQTKLLDAGFFDVTKIEQKLLEGTNDDEDMSMLEGKSDSEVFALIENLGASDNQDVSMIISQKAKKYPTYREITNPSGYVNTDEAIRLEDVVGEKVVLLDIMTYSCINCIRTFPYLNTWYDKYEDDGLIIIGIHTPEFAFEKDIDNVREAMKKYGIEFPVVLDNDYGTWRAYGNQYWPRKYLIDIDGFIVYDHIGEGAYDETEKKIQELLKERQERMDEEVRVERDISEVDAEQVSFARRSPEIYFGGARNKWLGNGQIKLGEEQTFILPAKEDMEQNMIYLEGTWLFTNEYAEARSADARVVFNYQAQKMFVVASAEEETAIQLLRDGEVVGEAAGEDAPGGVMRVMEEDLYRMIEADRHGSHQLEMRIEQPGVRLFTFTFG